MARSNTAKRCDCEDGQDHLPFDELCARLDTFFRASLSVKDLRCCPTCLDFLIWNTISCRPSMDIIKLHRELPYRAALVLLEGLTHVSVTRTRRALETSMLRCNRPHGPCRKETRDLFERFVEQLGQFILSGFIGGSQAIFPSPLTHKREHWPETHDQLFPAGVNEGVDALVYWCCAGTGPSPFILILQYLYTARNYILPRLLAPANRERFAGAMVHALSRSPVSWPGGTPPFQRPQGFRAQDDSCGEREMVEGIAPVIGVISDMGNTGEPSLTNLVAGYDAQFLAALEEMGPVLSRLLPDDQKTLQSMATFLRTRLGYSDSVVPPPTTERLLWQFARRTSPKGHGVCGNAACRAQQYSAAGKTKLFYCNRCRLVRYCSSDCQEIDWAAAVPHKLVCTMLAKLIGYFPDKPSWESFHAVWTEADLDPVDVENLRTWVLATGVVPPDSLEYISGTDASG